MLCPTLWVPASQNPPRPLLVGHTTQLPPNTHAPHTHAHTHTPTLTHTHTHTTAHDSSPPHTPTNEVRPGVHQELVGRKTGPRLACPGRPLLATASKAATAARAAPGRSFQTLHSAAGHSRPHPLRGHATVAAATAYYVGCPSRPPPLAAPAGTRQGGVTRRCGKLGSSSSFATSRRRTATPH